jgi:hypothetical protein
MLQRCGNLCDHNTIKNYKTRTEHMSKISNLESNQFIVFKIRYVVLHSTPAENIGLQFIQAQHTELNASFQTLESGTPDVVTYPYASKMGVPNMAFLPLKSQDLTEANGHIIRIPVDKSSYSNFSDVLEDVGSLEAGVIYVFIINFINPVVSGKVLGQAEAVGCNKLLIHYGTVGSRNLPSTVAGFSELNLGKTLVHEMGHAFYLFHNHPDCPTRDDPMCACDGSTTQFIFQDSGNAGLPLRRLPNDVGVAELPLTFVGNNSFGTVVNHHGGDNRSRDRWNFCTDPINLTGCSYNLTDTQKGRKNLGLVTEQYGCMSSSELSDANTPFEPFMYMMDYSIDRFLKGFTQAAIDKMRSHTTNSDLFSLAIVNSLDDSFTFTSVDEPSAETNSSSGLSTVEIVVMSIGILFALVVCVVLYLYRKAILGYYRNITSGVSASFYKSSLYNMSLYNKSSNPFYS